MNAKGGTIKTKKHRRRAKPKPRDEVDWALYRLRAHDRIIKSCLRQIMRKDAHTPRERAAAVRAAEQMRLKELRRFIRLIAVRGERRMMRGAHAETGGEIFAMLHDALRDMERLADVT